MDKTQIVPNGGMKDGIYLIRFHPGGVQWVGVGEDADLLNTAIPLAAAAERMLVPGLAQLRHLAKP